MGFIPANFQLPVPFLSRLRVRHGTDGLTDRQTTAANAPTLWGHNSMRSVKLLKQDGLWWNGCHDTSLHTFVMFCLDRITFGQPVSYTQPQISVTYLVFTAELTRGLACSVYWSFCYWYVLKLRTWTWTRSHVVLADLDLTWTWLLLDLIQVYHGVPGQPVRPPARVQ